ncbi:MAG: hypothetical protein E6I76_14655 [Chloroflexi bacterium]|nr:MAG: hypothetical protein E6I76_14655 [Chloroflexota bacterium]
MTSLRVGACLSLTGPYARFGVQAAVGLDAWRRLDGGAEVLLEDDGGDRARVPAALRTLAGRCDLLLGPYSTGLTRTAVAVIGESAGLLWNHGGAGDDVQAAAPGHVVSVLTPASRYAEPFLHVLAHRDAPRPLCIVTGVGSFARQVGAGARFRAGELGIEVLEEPHGREWDLLCAGSFEEDVAAVTRARGEERPPRMICAVAAGVREFGDVVAAPEGVHGVAQWFPGRAAAVDLGPTEADLLDACAALTGGTPDYPGVQAAAAAALAVHCARAGGGVDRETLWAVAAALDCATLFGRFRIDPVTGLQTGHDTVLVRWTADGLGR